MPITRSQHDPIHSGRIMALQMYRRRKRRFRLRDTHALVFGVEKDEREAWGGDGDAAGVGGGVAVDCGYVEIAFEASVGFEGVSEGLAGPGDSIAINDRVSEEVPFQRDKHPTTYDARDQKTHLTRTDEGTLPSTVNVTARSLAPLGSDR